MAQLAGEPHAQIGTLAIAFVVLRVLHGLLYISGHHLLRSAAWFAGYICVLWLLVQAALHITP
jgi:uncharacterized MAPEG superfamily protein